MKAIGGGDQDVRWIFLVEASLIGLIGGVFGLVLGWGVGRVINVRRELLPASARASRQPTCS